MPGVPRTRERGQPTSRHCQSNEGMSHLRGYSQFQADAASCDRAARDAANAGRGASAAQHCRPDAPGHLEQIRDIEVARLQRLQVPDSGEHAMVKLLARIIGVGIETEYMLVRPFPGNCEIVDGRALRGLLARPTRAASEDERGALCAPHSPSPAWDDPAGLALLFSEGQRIGPMVPRANLQRSLQRSLPGRMPQRPLVPQPCGRPGKGGDLAQIPQ